VTHRYRLALTMVTAASFAWALTACTSSGTDLANRSNGTSAVVLVDFSKSFVPLTTPDERALHDIAHGMAKLAKDEWSPPITVVWSRIQNASLLAQPLCEPIDYQQTLIKRVVDSETSSVDVEDLSHRLNDCAAAAAKRSAVAREQSEFTDISGAVTLAVEQGRRLGKKDLIIVSDFIEELPRGTVPIKVQLEGEKVLLLYRAGNELASRPPSQQLQRVQEWRDSLTKAGAASVYAMPFASVTCERVVRALSGAPQTGTDVVVLQNLPQAGGSRQLGALAAVIASAAAEWPSPVTVTWADVRDAGEPPYQMPPVVFSSRLIKKDDVCTMDDPASQLDEWAKGMQRFAPGTPNADLQTALRMYRSAGELVDRHVFVLISYFAQRPTGDLGLSGARVVLLPAGRTSDLQDETAYLERVNSWQDWLHKQGATVCKLPLATATSASLKSTLRVSQPPTGCK
jgi:hypothetical protein